MGLNKQMRYVFAFLLLFLSNISLASPPGETHIYGVSIHLVNNETLDGYIETDWLLHSCTKKKNDRSAEDFTWESFLMKQRKDIQSGRITIDFLKFMNELIEIKYKDASLPFVAESSVRKIRINEIRSIDAICRKWDGHVTVNGIKTLTDDMANYVSTHKLIASYVYDEPALAEAGKLSSDDCDLCTCTITYLSYNQWFTRKKLSTERKKIDKLPRDVLDRKRLIRFAECWD